MLRKFIRHIARPLLGEQDTARLAYQRYQGLALSDVHGNGGHEYFHSLKATQPVTIAPGPTHVVRDPTATGNPSAGPMLQPLSDDALTQAVNNAKQF